jgi:hypothetical protein
MCKVRFVSVFVLLVLLLSAAPGTMTAAQDDVVVESEVVPNVSIGSGLRAKDVFLEGYILQIDGNRLTIENEERLSTLLITDKTRLWKGKVTSLNQVEPGDYVYALGVPGKEVVATKVWVNIANFYGTVVDTRSDGLTLRIGGPRSEDLLTVYVNTNTILNEEHRADLEALSLRQGQFMQALGVYQKDGSLVATRLWTSFSEDNVGATCPSAGDVCNQSSRPDYSAQRRGTYVGTASWFCCGGVWGPCWFHGSGACSDCRSSKKHAAWPKLSNTNCDYSGCGMSLPWKSCGDGIKVKNLCSGDQVYVTIHDCGPAQRYYCNMPVGCGSCGSNCSALVDLTPYAFSRIANLDLGRIPAKVY